MAPEVRRGELTCAGDLYAAGVVLLELLASSEFLSVWLQNRARLLTGTARWDGRLPQPVERALGSQAGELRRLLGELLDDNAAARPEQTQVIAALDALR